jgi:hypothetical protein
MRGLLAEELTRLIGHYRQAVAQNQALFLALSPPVLAKPCKQGGVSPKRWWSSLGKSPSVSCRTEKPDELDELGGGNAAGGTATKGPAGHRECQLLQHSLDKVFSVDDGILSKPDRPERASEEGVRQSWLLLTLSNDDDNPTR